MYALAGLDPKSGKAGAPVAAASSSGASSAAAPAAVVAVTAEKPASSPVLTAALKLAPPKVGKKASKPAEVIKGLLPASVPASLPSPLPSPLPTAGSAGPSVLLGTHGWFKDIKVPYDPATPNDYRELVRELEAKKKAKELEEALEQKKAETSRKLASLAAPASQPPAASSSQPLLAPPPPPPLAPPLAPPPPPVTSGAGSDDPASKRQRIPPPPPPPFALQSASVSSGLGGVAGDGGGVGDGSGAGVRGIEDAEADPGLSMIQKMGWSEGQGLGKDGQGMRTPLVARKSDGATGVIVNAAERAMGRPPLPLALPPPPPPPPPGAVGGATGGATVAAAAGAAKGAVTFRGRPSRVLMLHNMVGPGEVDDELSGEIGEECSKYGEVLGVTIFEQPTTEAPASEGAVRIFVKFSKQAAAMKAYIDLDGRFFGGRNVSVAFYLEADYDASQLNKG